MNIVMFTNLYLPKVGGVAVSIDRFTRALRARGHRVVVVAPDFRGRPDREVDVIRLPSIRNINGSGFSLALPPPADLLDSLHGIEPDIVHTHHPFLLGDTAARLAGSLDLPLIYTHHTMYEHCAHYLPMESEVMLEAIVALDYRYTSFCDCVIAPSRSIAQVIADRGVRAPLQVVPTGLEDDAFAPGDGAAARRRLGLAPDDFVVGYVGRLVEEKNLGFLGEVVLRLVATHPRARFLAVGRGDRGERLRELFAAAGRADRLVLPGVLEGEALRDAYHAMDVFAFASRSETQGMVLAEAMAAGCPVVGLDAPGTRDTLADGEGGRLVMREDAEAFAETLREVADLDASEREALSQRARRTARRYSMDRCADRLETIYDKAMRTGTRRKSGDRNEWDCLLHGLKREWRIWTNRAAALGDAFRDAHRESGGEPVKVDDLDPPVS